MKVTEEMIDKILEEGENGALDPSPYMESLKYLIMEDDEITLTDEDQAYLIFLGTIALESLKRGGSYKEVDDEELLYDMEDANWDSLEEADGDLDKFITEISDDYPEQDLLDFLAFSVLPVDDDDDDDDASDEPVMSSEDGQVLGFMRLKAMVDAIVLPEV
ncbi:MAG: hypothetical protein M3R25_14365 [Bacteroidota bacterium]|nr:hypothetical protein [Bacteroidota bacterium]